MSRCKTIFVLYIGFFAFNLFAESTVFLVSDLLPQAGATNALFDSIAQDISRIAEERHLVHSKEIVVLPWIDNVRLSKDIQDELSYSLLQRSEDAGELQRAFTTNYIRRAVDQAAGGQILLDKATVYGSIAHRILASQLLACKILKLKAIRPNQKIVLIGFGPYGAQVVHGASRLLASVPQTRTAGASSLILLSLAIASGLSTVVPELAIPLEVAQITYQVVEQIRTACTKHLGYNPVLWDMAKAQVDSYAKKLVTSDFTQNSSQALICSSNGADDLGSYLVEAVYTVGGNFGCKELLPDMRVIKHYFNCASAGDLHGNVWVNHFDPARLMANARSDEDQSVCNIPGVIKKNLTPGDLESEQHAFLAQDQRWLNGRIININVLLADAKGGSYRPRMKALISSAALAANLLSLTKMGEIVAPERQVGVFDNAQLLFSNTHQLPIIIDNTSEDEIQARKPCCAGCCTKCCKCWVATWDVFWSRCCMRAGVN